jgi:hypothetical protein
LGALEDEVLVGAVARWRAAHVVFGTVGLVIFGWAKTVGGFRRTRYRDRSRTQLAAYMVGAAYEIRQEP